MNNVVNLIGRLGDTPACRTLNDGARLANLSIATDDGFKGANGEWVKRTTWHRVTVFGDKRVDYIEQNYGKGALVHFTGRISYSQWEKDGAKHYGVELVGSTSLLSAFKRDDEQTSSSKAKGKGKKAAPPQYDLDDEIPF